MALVQDHLSAADWERLDAEAFRPAYSLRERLAVLPWVLHRLLDEARRRVIADVGGPVLSVLWRLVLRRGFERRERAAFRHVPAARF
ncbi:hypothetical protein [Pseudonocardia sp. H11422]|uniref:hypothetical protein n=1 Tax=Pseudonocardia sp. H11422 TaxID=2835866 RepID=UPI0020297D81|nr:hypothetical protein [Pseudonocardia sp. H11422]